MVTSVLITFFRTHKIVNDKEEKKTSVVNEAGGKKSKGKEGSAQVSKVSVTIT